MNDAAAIVGIAETPFAKSLDGTETALACRVIVDACRDAGVDPSEVDGLASFTIETTNEVEVAKNIGAGDITFFSQVDHGGGAGAACIGHLAMAIATGRCDVGVAWRSRKRGSGKRPWTATASPPTVPAAYSRPWGVLRPVDEVALIMRRYMHEYGATRDHLANVALACRAHANNNPNAIMYDRPLDRAAYHDARWISEPLCLFDNCLETDGALACVLVSAERARDLPNVPVYVHATSQGLSPQHQGMSNYYNDDPLTGPGIACARRLYATSDLGPDDIDVAQIYDAFTPLVLFSLEAYGFCGRGEGAAFTEDGALGIGGRLPLNTSGGGLSEAYVHGFNLVNEAVRQLRGTSCNQVTGARAALVTSGESVPTSAAILRVD